MAEESAQVNATASESQLETPVALQRQPLVKAPLSTVTPEADVKEPAVAPAVPEGHGQFAEQVHQYVREYIRNADQKAGFFFAAATAVLAFLHSRGTAGRWLKSPTTWSFVDVLAFISMAGLAAAACVMLSVVMPRLKGSKRGLIFFNAVAEHESSAEYADEIARRTPADLIRLKFQHVYDLACVCRAKYRVLVVGFWIGGVGAVAALAFLLMARAG